MKATFSRHVEKEESLRNCNTSDRTSRVVVSCHISRFSMRQVAFSRSRIGVSKPSRVVAVRQTGMYTSSLAGEYGHMFSTPTITYDFDS